MSRRVIVVGGGVIGAAVGYYLLRSGSQVTIIDQGRFGGACSHANCGLICPSHVLPLATPGAVWNVLKTIFLPNSPVRLKPRVDFRLWGWLLQFARRCNRRDMLSAATGIQALLRSSRRLYVTLLRDESMDVEWEERGLLFVFQTDKAFEHYSHANELLANEFQMAARPLGTTELVEFEPALKPGLAGGWHYSDDAHVRPDRLMAEWKRVLEHKGVTIREHQTVEHLERQHDRIHLVRTKEQAYPADDVVIATGAWTPLLNKELRCSIPIQPGKGYSLTMDRPKRCPKTPLIFEEHRVAVTPFRTGYRLGSMMEFNGYDASLDPKRLNILREGAQHYLHEPLGEPVREEWWGWRPMTTDGNPFIGQVPGTKNLWVAAGHSMLGLSQAPATGQLLAELITNSEPHLDPTPYRLGR